MDDTRTPPLRYPGWQGEYETALLDGEQNEIAKRVTEAEYAIFRRLQVLSDGDHFAERQAIEDALKHLLVIKQQRLGYPNWQLPPA